MVTRRSMLTVMGSIAVASLVGAAFEADTGHSSPTEVHSQIVTPVANAEAAFLRPRVVAPVTPTGR
ncbi:hypothetical protein BKA23_0105 [Rudaeicoccus suwonensis]|uniref:Secreted protein n=1 Tax=Rudaeicoccus suwonensis TaxID=657409 RepID=A0A561E6V3_9MICO|nr:hypothetical protein BKA23_0105 [Rudaeicoccus suwonensis]